MITSHWPLLLYQLSNKTPLIQTQISSLKHNLDANVVGLYSSRSDGLVFAMFVRDLHGCSLRISEWVDEWISELMNFFIGPILSIGYWLKTVQTSLIIHTASSPFVPVPPYSISNSQRSLTSRRTNSDLIQASSPCLNPHAEVLLPSRKPFINVS